MPSIFLSYKRDHAPSETLVKELERELGDRFTVFRDVTIEPGKAWSRELYEKLLGCDAGIALVSKEANGADWCRREWTLLAARNQTAGLPVIPIHVDDDLVATAILDHLQGLKWSHEAWPRLRELLENVATRVQSPLDFLAAHQAWLRWQFNEKPVFGHEPYSLKDAYIDTECGVLQWATINEPARGSRVDAFKQANGGRQDLLEATLARLADPNFRDLVVVQAGPGSGKSAFTLRLANELMALGFLPILVRFRDLRLAKYPDLGELIDDAIRIGAADDESPNAPPEMKIVATVLKDSHELRGTKLCKAVFILDGWDEVSLTGNVSYQAQLKEWLPKVRQFLVEQRGTPVRVILTGRPSSEVGESGVLRRETPVLTLRPIRADQLRTYACRLGELLAGAARRGGTPSWSIDETKLKPVFEAYGEWAAKYAAGNESEANTSTDVLGTPLLAFLALRVLADSSVDPGMLLNQPSALYYELIDATTRHAGKGEGEKLEGAVHRGGEGLRVLLQEVASTISILRSESVSYSELAARFQDEGLPIWRDVLGEWSQTEKTESTLRELVVNFYFKGGNKAIGCEFMHKSFREYLYAEAIVAALEQAYLSKRPWERVPESKEAYARDFTKGTVEFEASRRLAYLVAPQWLSSDVQKHVRWLLERAARLDRDRWRKIRDLAVSLYAWWAEGVHLRHQPSGSRMGDRWRAPFVDELFKQAAPFDDPDQAFIPVRTTGLDAHLGLALLRITNILSNAIPDLPCEPEGRRATYQRVAEKTVFFRPGGGFLLAIIARMNAEGWRLWDLSILEGAVDLSGEGITGILGHATLAGAQFVGAQIYRTKFSFSSLNDANFRGARLTDVTLRGTSLMRADLRDTAIVADLSGANLKGALLTNANLLGADLKGANLAGANLDGAKIRRSVLCSALHDDEIIGEPFFIEEGTSQPE